MTSVMDVAQATRPSYTPVQVIHAVGMLYDQFAEHIRRAEFKRVREGRAVALMILAMFVGTGKTRWMQYSEERTPDYYMFFREEGENGRAIKHWNWVEVVEFGPKTETGDLVEFLSEEKLWKGYGDKMTLLCDITKTVLVPPAEELHDLLKRKSPTFQVMYVGRTSEDSHTYHAANIWPKVQEVDFELAEAMRNYPDPFKSVVVPRFVKDEVVKEMGPLDPFQVFGLNRTELERKLATWNRATVRQG